MELCIFLWFSSRPFSVHSAGAAMPFRFIPFCQRVKNIDSSNCFLFCFICCACLLEHIWKTMTPNEGVWGGGERKRGCTKFHRLFISISVTWTILILTINMYLVHAFISLQFTHTHTHPAQYCLSHAHISCRLSTYIYFLYWLSACVRIHLID